MRTPDYDLAPTLPATGDAVHRALGDPRRRRILALLSERAATAKQLGVAINRSTTTAIHHLDVLAEAGLVRVVRTERVRATEQRWWGRTARVFLLGHADDRGDAAAPRRMLEDAAAAAEAGRAAGLATEDNDLTTVRYARIPADRAAEWHARLSALADEFGDQPRDGDVVHGVAVSLFPTAWPPLPREDA